MAGMKLWGDQIFFNIHILTILSINELPGFELHLGCNYGKPTKKS